jgi:hypothetical protein
MKRRPAVAALSGLAALAVSGPAALAGGGPDGGGPVLPGPVAGPDWEPGGLAEPAQLVVLAGEPPGETPYAVTRPGGGAPTAVWRGDPGGGSWTPLPAPTPRIVDLAAHPTDPGVVFAAGDGGVYRSVDAGATWERVVVPRPSYAGLTVAVSRADPAVVYAATGLFSGATTWRSLDGGSGWQVLRDLQGALCTWTFPVVAPDPAVRGRVYLSYSCAAGRTMSATLSQSDDLWATDGRTLLRPTLRSDDPLGYLFPAAVAFDPAGRRGVVAARRDPRLGGSAILGTENGGASWGALLNYPPPPRPGGTPQGQGTVAGTLLAGFPDLRHLVAGLAGTGQGTIRSEDGGATWTVLGDPAIGRVNALAGDPGSEAGTLYAATERGLWRLSLAQTTD